MSTKVMHPGLYCITTVCFSKSFPFMIEKINKALRSRLSPAEEWALKKSLKSKRHLTRGDSNVIKSGWKIRHELHKIKR